METISFVLGMSLMAVIAIAVVAFIAFVKVRKLETRLENDERSLYELHDRTNVEISTQVSEVYRRVADAEREIFSQLDSRLDKLETKLTIKK